MRYGPKDRTPFLVEVKSTKHLRFLNLRRIKMWCRPVKPRNDTRLCRIEERSSDQGFQTLLRVSRVVVGRDVAAVSKRSSDHPQTLPSDTPRRRRVVEHSPRYPVVAFHHLSIHLPLIILDTDVRIRPIQKRLLLQRLHQSIRPTLRRYQHRILQGKTMVFNSGSRKGYLHLALSLRCRKTLRMAKSYAHATCTPGRVHPTGSTQVRS